MRLRGVAKQLQRGRCFCGRNEAICLEPALSAVEGWQSWLEYKKATLQPVLRRVVDSYFSWENELHLKSKNIRVRAKHARP